MGRLKGIRALACAVPALAIGASDAAARTPPTFQVGDRSQVIVVKRGGGAHRLTGGATSHSSPSWSRRGWRIATSAGRDVAILSLDGRVRHEIRGASFTGPVAWSPGDRRVAFVSYHPQGERYDYEGNLVVTDVDGGHRRIVAVHADGQPAWSRDGTTLYYRRGSYSGTAPQSLYAVSAEGGPHRRVSGDVRPGSRLLPSPDGRSVLFLKTSTARRNGGLWIASTVGRGTREVVSRPVYGPRSYGWVPGGREVFEGKAHRTHPRVTTLRGESRALGASFYSGQYELAPAGRWLAWFREGNTDALLASRWDGTRRRTLARFRASGNTTDPQTLAWSPDGRRLAVVVSRHQGD